MYAHAMDDSRVCPACGEPLGDATEGACSRCGGLVSVDGVTGRLVVLPAARRRRISLFWPVALILFAAAVGVPILLVDRYPTIAVKMPPPFSLGFVPLVLISLTVLVAAIQFRMLARARRNADRRTPSRPR